MAPSSNRHILFIGSLSNDEIHVTDEGPSAGGIAIVNIRHKELGGRGGNAAIAAFRSYNPKPNTPDHYVDQSYEAQRNREDPERPCVHVIGACASEVQKDGFVGRMKKNGIEYGGIKVLTRLEGEEAEEDQSDEDVKQDFLLSIMDRRTGHTMQSAGFNSSNQWSTTHFRDVDAICQGYRPDLVVITMELKKRIVEHLLNVFNDAGIEVLLFASPGETLALSCYPKITHLICNQADAARMLGYKVEDVNMDTWPEIVAAFANRKVKNVVLKVGPLGAYYKTENDEGYASAFRPLAEMVDQTGATATFVGAYAMAYLQLSANDPSNWDISEAVVRGNKACYYVVGGAGYDKTMAWADEIDALDQEPVVSNIEELKQGRTKKKTFGFRARKAQNTAEATARETAREPRAFPGSTTTSTYGQAPRSSQSAFTPRGHRQQGSEHAY